MQLENKLGTALLVVALALSGCSSLLIDVDVYKGPLVNQEEVQREQLIAMAMSAKSLLLATRNEELDDVCPDWAVKTVPKRRLSFLPNKVWLTTLKKDKDGNTTAWVTGLEGCRTDQVKAKPDALKRAFRINQILSAFTNRDESNASEANSLGSGRIDEGIDWLANDYAKQSDEALKAQHNGSRQQSCADACADAFARLEHALTDLAGRMQFLATNLWLIDAGATDVRHNKDKTLFESIANNIIVHADDLRRQATFRNGQQDAAAREWRAADSAFALDATANIAAIEAALGVARAAASGPPVAQPTAMRFTVADYDATAEAVAGVKDRLSADLRSEGASPSIDTLLTRLRTMLKVQADSAGLAIDKQARLKKADEVLRDTVVTAPILAGNKPSSSTDVLDGVIAQLRYRHLDLLRRLGPADAQTQNAEAALAAAQQQRNDMVYLRPTSSYLRSVYATTATQSDPGLQWQNMLFETSLPVRTIREWKERGLFNPLTLSPWEVARADLDKAYWQNINSVKVGAAGSSNFVVAKDDVGNWYVKAMGTDPGAMVRAARNLALYNAGAGLNTDLLRVNELRTKIDVEENTDKRTAMRSELNGLTGSAGGPTTTERSRTLTLFRKNYADLSEKQRDALSQRLSSREFRNVMVQRWTTTLAASDAKARDGLIKTFDQPELAATYQRAVTAAAKLPDGTVPDAPTIKPVGDRLLDALSALQGWRGQLKAAVFAADGLIATELAASAKADEELASAQRNLADMVTRRDKASQMVTEADKQLQRFKDDTGGTISQSQRDNIDANWLAARTGYDDAVANANQAEGLLVTKRSALDAAQKVLAGAKLRQQAAAADVDGVLKTAIDDIIKQRLQLVRDTETAVKIVGGTGGS
jgi:hypothetical protein